MYVCSRGHMCWPPFTYQEIDGAMLSADPLGTRLLQAP
jgi:hypothetical protein